MQRDATTIRAKSGEECYLRPVILMKRYLSRRRFSNGHDVTTKDEQKLWWWVEIQVDCEFFPCGGQEEEERKRGEGENRGHKAVYIRGGKSRRLILRTCVKSRATSLEVSANHVVRVIFHCVLSSSGFEPSQAPNWSG